MPSIEHPFLVLIAIFICLWASFPVARFFFDDFETFKNEFGLSRDWERSLWLLGFAPANEMIYFKIVGFIGILGMLFFATYSLGLRVIS